jgi:hypothetical protein
MWILPSCTGSVALAISSSLRAAAAGSASGLGATYFMGSPYPSRARRTAGTFPDLVDFRTENYWLSVITSGGGRHQIVRLSPECPIHARHRRLEELHSAGRKGFAHTAPTK